jgi:glutamate carboxypeptidase
MERIYEQLRRYIDGQRQPMLALWEKLVNTESGSRQIDGVNQVCGILRREMEAAGIQTRTIPMENAGDMLIGEWNMESGKAPLLLIGHMDTVFKEGAAKENPFRIDGNGMAHGPGVLDMKPGLIMALYIVKALAAAGWRERPIKLIFAGDEENLHMFSNTKELFAKEAEGALAAFNFETGYMDNRFVVGRSGGGPVSILVHGVASHSGIAPEKGRSAVLEAAHKIVEIEAQNDIPRGRLINCGMVSGGLGENTIPDACAIRIGVRFQTMAVGQEIFGILQKATNHSTVPDTTAELDLSRVMQCMDTTSGVMALFEHLKQTAADTGFGEIGCFRSGSLSDSGITVSCGVPTVCGMGPRGEGNHTPDEYADVESFYQRCVLAACAAATLRDDFMKE